MDHQNFISNLSNETRDDLTERLNSPGLVRLTFHWGLIILFGLVISLGLPGWKLLMIPQGILIVFSFTLLHEAIHCTPFRTEWLNQLAGRTSAFLIFLPPTWFKYFHFAHHRYTQNPEKDPELITPKPKTTLSFIKHVSGIPTWIGHFKALLNNASGACKEDFIPKKAIPRITNEARIQLLAYVLILSLSIFLESSALFWAWVFPLALGQPFLRIYLLAEHGDCPTVTNMLENSRTTYTNNIIRFVAWNMPYHTEHHSYPTVPFHKLPKLHKIMRSELVHTEPGYATFTQKYVKKHLTNL